MKPSHYIIDCSRSSWQGFSQQGQGHIKRITFEVLDCQGKIFGSKDRSSLLLCRKLEGRSYTLPPQADLPSYRVRESSPFSKIGLDMAGPLYHKLKDGTMEKCYVALFTCCVTRAVHLEITLDLSTEAFL